LALAASLGVARAGNTTVVVMADPERAAALDSALQVTLSGRDVVIASSAAPEGALRLARAAAAQHTAVSLKADAALWVDREGGSIEVCAVSPDGGYFRHAPIASESPRAFAEIAASLLDELFAPPEGVNVHVDVHVDGELAGATTLPIATAPPVVPPPALAPSNEVATSAWELRPRASHVLMEVGPTMAFIAGGYAAGIEGEIAVPLTSWLRLGVGGHLLTGLTSQAALPVAGPESTFSAIYDVFGELRATGAGRRHVDLGLIGGFVPSNGIDPNLVEVGGRLSYTWDGPLSGISVSLVPCVIHSALYQYTGGAAFATLRWELPL
jgi:hypothetical protein